MKFQFFLTEKLKKKSVRSTWLYLIVANSPPLEGLSHPQRVPSPPPTPTCHHPRRTPKQTCSSPWPTNCQLMLNKLDFSTIMPCRRSKSTSNSTQYIFSLFLYKQRQSWCVNGSFTFHLVFYKWDIYASKWLK